MLVAGLDIGSRYTKMLIIDDSKDILGRKEFITSYNTTDFDEALNKLCEEVKIGRKDLSCIISTGANKEMVDFSNGTITETFAAARAIHYLFPKVRTIIEVGYEISKAIKIDEDGNIMDSVTNEKCAAGAGSFVETMAITLNMSIEDFSLKSLESEKKISISAQCAVFAESEAISLIHSGVDRRDIAKAVNEAIANRVASLARRIRVEEEVALIGGVAKNIGFISSLKSNLLLDNLIIPSYPSFIVAYGAALYALSVLSEKGTGKTSESK